MSNEPLIYFNNPPYCESRQPGFELELIEFDSLVPAADRAELSCDQAERHPNPTLHFVTLHLLRCTDRFHEDYLGSYYMGRYHVGYTAEFEDKEGRDYQWEMRDRLRPELPVGSFRRIRAIVSRHKDGTNIGRRFFKCDILHTCGNITQLPHRIFDACEFEFVQFHKRVPKANTPEKRLELLHEYAIKVLYNRDRSSHDIVRKDFDESGIPLRPWCFACRKQSNLRHHIIPIEYGGTNDPRNIVPLCTPCHEEIHPHLRDKHWLALGLPRSR